MQNTPDILQYKSIKNYLNDYFQFRNYKDGHFSYDIWSSELNYKSRSFIPMIMAGQRNVSPEFIDNFSKKMNFNKTQTQHMSVLAMLHQNAHPELKPVLEDSLFKTLNIDQKRSIVQDESFSSFVINPLIQMLISFKDFKATFENIKKLLGLKAEALEKALSILEKLKLIRKSSDNNSWEAESKSFEVKQTNSGLKKFHQDTLSEAMDQLDLEDSNKKFRSIYFSINPENMSDMSKDIEEFLKKLRTKYGSDTLDQQQIIKVNLQSYPLSEVFHK